jgi:Domain of unknown function (DUF4912)
MRSQAKKHSRRWPVIRSIASRHKKPSPKISSVKPADQLAEVAPPATSYSFDTSVPQMMCAVPRDPDSIFVYWEIAPNSMDRLRKAAGDDAFGSSQWVVRVIDVTDISFDGANAWQTLDITIDRGERKKYVKAPEPGRTYLLEYGLLTPDGSFLEAVRSNACAVPRKGVSDRLDEAWSMANTAELIRISTDAFGNNAAAGKRLNGLGIALGEGSGSGGIM